MIGRVLRVENHVRKTSNYDASLHKNHIMAWVGRDLEAFSLPTHQQGCPPPPAQLPRASSNLALSASRDGALQLLWAACTFIFFKEQGPVSEACFPYAHCSLEAKWSTEFQVLRRQ